MKYLKLFEDHKETSDKISEIERLAKEQSDEVINEYKELIDEIMYDISDDYETESVINLTQHLTPPHCKTYLDYRIYFTGDKYEDLLSKLLEVVRRLKDAYDVSYNIKGIFTSLKKLPGSINYYTTPLDFVEGKKMVKKHIDINSRTKPSDIKLSILISF